jgi:hypothetical protein
MNIDERLERLTGRHEALTKTMGLIAAAQLVDTMNRLGNVVIALEERIERLEDHQ